MNNVEQWIIIAALVQAAIIVILIALIKGEKKSIRKSH